MGDDLERRRAKHFKHLADRKYEQLKELTLFAAERQEVYTRWYRCTVELPALAAVGARVLVRRAGDTGAEVIIGNRRLGDVAAEDVKDLLGAIAPEPLSGIAAAVVEEVSDLTGDIKFSLRFGRDDDNDK